MSDPVPPRFRARDRAECVSILARNQVGRLARARGARADVEPPHHVDHDGWLHGRTSPGARTRATGEAWAPAAFEVDGWALPPARSALARKTA